MRRPYAERVTVAAAIWASIATFIAMFAQAGPFPSLVAMLTAGAIGGTVAHKTTREKR